MSKTEGVVYFCLLRLKWLRKAKTILNQKRCSHKRHCSRRYSWISQRRAFIFWYFCSQAWALTLWNFFKLHVCIMEHAGSLIHDILMYKVSYLSKVLKCPVKDFLRCCTYIHLNYPLKFADTYMHNQLSRSVTLHFGYIVYLFWVSYDSSNKQRLFL
jgi:hypothetical protein